jgi:putative hydrolase of the HAD superfamily
MDAVVFDLFGTLVAAPTPHERSQAASRLAALVGCEAAAVESYLLSSWLVRHDGTCRTLSELATHLVRAISGPAVTAAAVSEELRSLAGARLMPDPSIVRTLETLRDGGLRLGVLSDASAEIAAAWPACELAPLLDAIVFSCHAGAVKPDLRLYHRTCRELGAPAHRVLYVGDGGGDELHGALAAGMAAVRVHRRGTADGLAFGATPWAGSTLDSVERVPAYLAGLK